MNTAFSLNARPHPLRNIIPVNGRPRPEPDLDQVLRELQINHYRRQEAAVEDLRHFFQEESGQVVSITWKVNVMDLLMTQRAVADALADWRIVREARYCWRSVEVVERYAVEVAPKKYDFMLREGRQFWEGPAGRRLAIDVCVDDDEKESEESEITFNIPRADHDWLCQLLPRLKEWRDRHHFLRGQSFSAKGNYLDLGDATEWEDVILPDALRDAIQRNCIGLLAHGALYKINGIPLKRGIILHGPPGTGKTMIGRALARRCGVTFILITPGMLEEAADVRRVFTWARRFAPTILFFEDFDLIAGNRHGSQPGDILGEFLSGLDGVDSSEGIITIATTNDLKAIEPALKDRPNRIDCVLEVPPLGRPERADFLERWRRRHPGSFTPERWAIQTQGFTGAQLNELCRLAVFDAIEERINQGRTAPEQVALSDDNFHRALEKFPRRAKSRIGFNPREDEE